ncbi:MAG: hypothetical protein Kow0065_09740 [Methylomicrobium sp.]
MPLDFIIDQWAVWPPLPADEPTPDRGLNQVPALLRRRLSPLAKNVVRAIEPCLNGDVPIPAVFSSCHGELAKTFAMMQQLEAGEEISPTSFSLSVHNAIAGLFSMIWRNKLECTVLAPGEEGIAPAFIEAAGLFSEGAEQVLLVFYDDPLVPFYPAAPYKLSVDRSLAFAMRVAKQGGREALRLTQLPVAGDDGEQPVQLPIFIEFLSNPETTSLVLKTARHSWRWEKIGRLAD